jgi:hypothetical protein
MQPRVCIYPTVVVLDRPCFPVLKAGDRQRRHRLEPDAIPTQPTERCMTFEKRDRGFSRPLLSRLDLAAQVCVGKSPR